MALKSSNWNMAPKNSDKKSLPRFRLNTWKYCPINYIPYLSLKKLTGKVPKKSIKNLKWYWLIFRLSCTQPKNYSSSLWNLNGSILNIYFYVYLNEKSIEINLREWLSSYLRKSGSETVLFGQYMTWNILGPTRSLPNLSNIIRYFLNVGSVIEKRYAQSLLRNHYETWSKIKFSTVNHKKNQSKL